MLLKCYGQFTFRFPKLFPSVNHSVLKSQWTDIFVLPWLFISFSFRFHFVFSWLYWCESRMVWPFLLQSCFSDNSCWAMCFKREKFVIGLPVLGIFLNGMRLPAHSVKHTLENCKNWTEKWEREEMPRNCKQRISSFLLTEIIPSKENRVGLVIFFFFFAFVKSDFSFLSAVFRFPSKLAIKHRYDIWVHLKVKFFLGGRSPSWIEYSKPELKIQFEVSQLRLLVMTFFFSKN